ncbi:hypothetical protein DVA86_20065 [Streptomyces armeniacus]|uniref:Uncharacterized protein n=1 Tax=Streptomyces armeniacus TaxID=83291 RepID=A0A345XSI6_9ACTN|nr:hypothetical protein [Streptomyces armeniacus]AXK34602.1 hypothetical protein DVA86_20065 [Streptomyces armeniacus]
MTRLKKIFVLSAVAAGIVAAASGPALASQPQGPHISDRQTTVVVQDHHGAAIPQEGDHHGA